MGSMPACAHHFSAMPLAGNVRCGPAAFVRQVRDNTLMDREQPLITPALEPEDYYFEGPNIVFTETYHLKRGYCCGSGCRHCPFGNAQGSRAHDPDQGATAPAPDAP